MKAATSPTITSIIAVIIQAHAQPPFQFIIVSNLSSLCPGSLDTNTEPATTAKGHLFATCGIALNIAGNTLLRASSHQLAARELLDVDPTTTPLIVE